MSGGPYLTVAANHHAVSAADPFASGTFVQRLAGYAFADQERWPLWTPVGLGLGVALYFVLATEPPGWLGAVCALSALALAATVGRRPEWRAVALAAFVVAGGFAAAQARSHWVAAPILAQQKRPVMVTGRILENAVRGSGRRLLLDSPRIDGIDGLDTPQRVRVTLRGADGDLVPGTWVRLRARLSPPPGPSAPGAFDFARRAYFNGLGAVGFALGPARRIDPPADAPADPWLAPVGRLRHAVTARILSGLDGQAGAVAAALLTGERGAIAKPVLSAMRDAGLAHLLAISGLHLGLVGGILFFVLRAALALTEPLALRFPIKKWAACAALAGTGFYLLLSGATVPTQRAFLMSALVLAAILLDRNGVSLRSVAWAAVAVLLFQPESLLGASFQMSFSAVVALVAVYEAIRERRKGRREQGLRRVAFYFAGVALMSLIAGLATAPVAAYHFNRLAAFGLAANMAAVPLTALWIMPWGVAALALMPLGLEGLALTPMGWGIDAVIAVAGTVAGWPGAVTLLPAMPFAALLLICCGGLWLCLWRRPWRWFGVVAIAAGLVVSLFPRTPDILVDGKGKLFAVRGMDGRLALSSKRSARFAAGIWLRRNGQATPAPWPGDDEALRCDSVGCIYRAEGRTVALLRDGRALDDDCLIADVVLATVPLRRPCLSAAVTVDRFDLWRKGAHAVYFEDGTVRVESVASLRGDRPWVRLPGR